MIPNNKSPTFLVAAPTEPSKKIEMYSPSFYAACTARAILSCGLTHMTVTLLDLVKCNMQAIEKIKELTTIIEGKSLEEKKSLLAKCAATTLSSKLIGGEKEFFASMVVNVLVAIGDEDRLNMIGMKKPINTNGWKEIWPVLTDQQLHGLYLLDILHGTLLTRLTTEKLSVHAYERSNRVYNYTLDKCGPLYITVGDGENREKMAIRHADEPGECPDPLLTPDTYMGGFCASNFTSRPAPGNFCWDRQPDYNAFQESSFGHGILEPHRFHEFLKLENEIGNMTRQEAAIMVPPLFLDVQPDHYILDMCATPGSKTFQLLKIIYQSTKPGSLPRGLIVANDLDVQRCNLLIYM